MRNNDPTAINNTKIAKDFSIPHFWPNFGAKGEIMAKLKSGMVVKIPNELTDTPNPLATSLITGGIDVNGMRNIIPIITMPGTKKVTDSCFA